eukprot:jgi/Mesvir1/1587/Mv14555-RA.2
MASLPNWQRARATCKAAGMSAEEEQVPVETAEPTIVSSEDIQILETAEQPAPSVESRDVPPAAVQEEVAPAEAVERAAVTPEDVDLAPKSVQQVSVVTGPIIGKTTSTSSNIVVEFDASMDITCTLTPEGATGTQGQVSVTRAVKKNVPAVFVFEGLVAATQYDFAVLGVKNQSDRTGSVKTLRTLVGDDSRGLKVGVISCNKIDFTETQAPGFKDMWEVLWSKHNAQPFDYLVHIGDQIYADNEMHDADVSDEAVLFNASKVNQNSAYVQSRLLLKNALNNDPARFPEVWEQVLEFYRVQYRRTWNHVPTQKVLASVPNVMVWDDHEIRDDFGDSPNDRKFGPESPDRFVTEAARVVYYEYQRQLWDPSILARYAALKNPTAEVIDQSGKIETESYIVELAESVAVMMLDLRGGRTYYRGDEPTMALRQSKAEARMGPAAWNMIHSALKDMTHIKTWLIGSPVPMVLYNTTVAMRGGKFSDDLLGQWSTRENRMEMATLLNALTTWQMASPDRCVTLLGGDVHMGGFTHIVWRKTTLPSTAKTELMFRQLTASPIANATPTGMLKMFIKGLLGSTGIVPNTHLKFRHHDFLTEPNYGIVKIFPNKGDKALDMKERVQLFLETSTKGLLEEPEFVRLGYLQWCCAFIICP